MTRKWGDIVSIIFNTKNQPSPSLTFYTNVRLALFRPITMSVTEFENDWILLAKKAMLPVTGGGGGGGVGFKSSCDNYHSTTPVCGPG